MHETATAKPDAALYAALARAQASFPPIAKEKTVTVKTQQGGHYSFSYATLDAILNACRPALNENGLAIVQRLSSDGNGNTVLGTHLVHEDGAMLGSTVELPGAFTSPQQLGSLLTYLRRYALTALLGVAAEEDDDGRQAAEPTKDAEKKAAKPKASAATLQAISDLILDLARLEGELGNTATDWNAWAKEYASVGSATELDPAGADRLVVGLLREKDRLVAAVARQMDEAGRNAE